MAKAVIIVYERGTEGPAWAAARSAFDIGEYIEGAVGIDANKPSAQSVMSQHGITAPCIIIGRYCSQGGQIKAKHLAKMPGIPSPQAIANAAAKVMQSAAANSCAASPGPIPTAPTGTGNDDNDNDQGGFGFNPWGIFSLPIDAPWWLWAVLAGGAAVGSTSANGKVGRYGWGAVAIVAGGNAYTAYNKE